MLVFFFSMAVFSEFIWRQIRREQFYRKFALTPFSMSPFVASSTQPLFPSLSLVTCHPPVDSRIHPTRPCMTQLLEKQIIARSNRCLGRHELCCGYNWNPPLPISVSHSSDGNIQQVRFKEAFRALFTRLLLLPSSLFCGRK